MNNQEAFDAVMNWLTRPGASQCIGEDGGCVYYDPITDNRCAIGGIIPLDQAKELGNLAIGIEGLMIEYNYLDSFEEEDVRVISQVTLDSIRSQFSECDEDLLDDLQRLHDTVENWRDNRFVGYGNAERIADRYGLNYAG